MNCITEGGGRQDRALRIAAWLVLAVGAATTVAFFVLPTASLAINCDYQAGATFVVLAAWVAALRYGAATRYRLLFLGAATAWLLGDSIWWVLDLVGHPAGFPSFVDLVYVAAYPLAIGGVIVLWRLQFTSVLGGLLDSAALAAAAGLLLWATVVDPTGGQHGPLLGTLTAIGYPALDMFVVIGLAQLVSKRALRRTRALQALTAGMVVYLISDSFYAYTSLRGTYVDSTWRDTGWLLLYVLWAFAALHPSVRELETSTARELPTRPTRIVVLALGCLTAPLAMFIAYRRHALEPALYAASIAAIFLIVFWRMAVIFAEYRRAQTAAAESQEFYRALVENGTDLVMLLTLNGDVLFASPSFERILGYSPAELEGTSILALTEPDDLPIAAGALGAAEAGAAIEPFTIRARDANGATVWLEVTAGVIATRSGRAILSQARDVTQRRHTERSLAETSRTLETLVTASPTAVVALDREAHITLWSPGATQLFGWTAEEVLGRLTPLRREDEIGPEFFERYIEGGPVVEETTRLHKDGRLVDVSLSSLPLHAPNGTPNGTIGVFLDLSERKQLEESLRQAQRLESVGLLAGGVAHDFNNLLTAICGYTYFAQQRAGDDRELRECLDEIAHAGERATDLTRQLLAFGRRQRLQPTTFDLNRTITESTSLLSRLLGEDVRVETVFRSEQCGVLADPGQIEQVLVNLAVNARDAMASGGTLTIETYPAELAGPEAETLGLEAGPHVVLRVGDTGVGMDADTAARAFDPFFTTKPVGKGTGLGLATVYGIVHQSGGAITIESRPGSGTSVRVFLPEHPSEQAGAKSVERPSAPRGRERVLLVEDENAVRQLTSQLLEAQGYDVISTAGPLEALQLADGAAIDLLATDIVMPDMDGTRLAEKLRDGRPELPVLFLSGYPRGAALDAALVGPRTGFLQKPYNIDELARAVRAALDGTLENGAQAPSAA